MSEVRRLLISVPYTNGKGHVRTILRFFENKRSCDPYWVEYFADRKSGASYKAACTQKAFLKWMKKGEQHATF